VLLVRRTLLPALAVATATLFVGPSSFASAPGECVVERQSKGASICVTEYEGDKVSFTLAGFQPRTRWRVAGEQAALAGRIGYDGTNTSPARKPPDGSRTRISNVLQGGGVENGLTVTGTSRGGARVKIQVSPP
jgi:hypothetical protein